MDNSKQYLLEIVDEQKKTIEKYTSKLRDVVAAHKSLLVEKKALEDTIKILNESKVAEPDLTISTESASQSELKSQLDSLLASFSKLVAEKSHMEECFRTSQKQLMEEKETVENKCKELQDQVRVLLKQLKSEEPKKVSKKKQEARENDLSIQIKNYEKEVKNLQSELEAKKLIQELSEKKLKESAAELSKLQEAVQNLQIEHEIALKQEKEKAKDVEEHAKKLTAIQEERVVNLETRLAELSETIGTYDRLRLQDQKEIQKLKDHIAFVDVGQKGTVEQPKLENDDYNTLLTKFLELKKQLIETAQKCGREEDLKNLFYENLNEDIHLPCKDEYNKLKTEFEFFKNETKNISQPNVGKKLSLIQNQVKNLLEKIKIQTAKKIELEREHQIQIEQLNKTLINEKARFKEILAASEADHKARVWLLEEQLQKQRERSLGLLEEKEQEIHTLQNTFQMFLPGYGMKSEEDSNDTNVLSKNQYIDGPHIVHYANELARRDVEISSLRRNKHQIEISLRELKKNIATTIERHKEEKQLLNDEIERLERRQTREGANLEYLKNVVYNFLLSNDLKTKRHMFNAIAAVLKFSEVETQKIADHNKYSW